MENRVPHARLGVSRGVSSSVEEIKISADKAGKRARRLDNFDFEELAPDPADGPVVIPRPAE